METPPLRTWKIKFKDPHLIKPIFDKWFNDYKYAYNKANWLQEESSCYYSAFDLRNLVTPKEVSSHIPWFLETPKDIRASGVFQNHENRQSAFTNLKNKNINHFEMKYLTKRKSKYRYCFGIPGSAFSVINPKLCKIYSSYTNDYPFRFSKPIPERCISESKKLLRDHKIYFNGKDFYLLLAVEATPKNIQNRTKLVAIDPGVRKFVTTWEHNKSYTFGTRKFRQIKDLLLKRDKYQGRKDWYNFHKIETRIKNLVSELHHSTSTFLLNRYENIILPELDVRRLVKKTDSREYRKAMLRLKIREFNNLLKTKAKNYNSRIICDEDGVTKAYSSRMCSRCKYINKKSKDEWKICSNCNFSGDRDVNAAKNIYFMNRHLL